MYNEDVRAGFTKENVRRAFAPLPFFLMKRPTSRLLRAGKKLLGKETIRLKTFVHE
jgi:hypothetical protein